jgi:hypothetical protein
MSETFIYLYGYKLKIRYAIYDPHYIEWRLIPDQDTWTEDHEVLNLLLRMHHNDYIESIIRESEYYSAYARDAEPF